ncbi:hypothetical protein DENSPDRAFT_231544 [Dentipellis sp. KUC8613]|nr:hypothetical protein DENSPDRAFT_231544 [Dentipellis sp. KUC8613]
MCGEKYFAVTISDLWVVSVLYGLYVALFGGSIYVLIRRRRNTLYAGSSIALFLLTTTFAAVSLVGVLVEPVITADSQLTSGGQTVTSCDPGTSSPDRMQEILSANIYIIVKSATQMCISVIADGILVHRCMVLWPQVTRRWIGISLGTLLMASTALNCASLYYQVEFYLLNSRQGHSGSREQLLKVIQMGNKFGSANNMMDFAYNAIITMLIAHRIWSLARTLENTLGRTAGVRYRAALAIVIESGSAILVSQVLDTSLGFSVSPTYAVSWESLTAFYPVRPALDTTKIF